MVQWLLTTGMDANATYQKKDGTLANALTRARKADDHSMARILEEGGCNVP